jgi:DNA-binding SARP family transcriptional activator
MYSTKNLADGTVMVPDRPEQASGIDTGFTVLGPLALVRDGVDYAPTTPKLLQLLALLVLRPGKMVHADAIAQELWAGKPPRTMRTTMHTYVYHLRRCLDEHGLGSLLETKAPGYVFRIDPAQVDVFRFGQLHQEGQELLREEQYAAAVERFRSALDVWNGPPLANVPSGPMLLPYTVELLEQRRTTMHMLFEAEIASGHHRELIGELRAVTAGNPLDEALHGQLMRVLGRSGRRSDAMLVYRTLRKRLSEELGVEPCADLQILHHDLISEGDHS